MRFRALLEKKNGKNQEIIQHWSCPQTALTYGKANQCKHESLISTTAIQDHAKIKVVPAPDSTDKLYLFLRKDDNKLLRFSYKFVPQQSGDTAPKVYWPNMPELISPSYNEKGEYVEALGTFSEALTILFNPRMNEIEIYDRLQATNSAGDTITSSATPFNNKTSFNIGTPLKKGSFLVSFFNGFPK